MSILTTRIHSNTAAHAFLSRCIHNFESACARVAKIVHQRKPCAPLPTINDAVASVIEADSALMAEFFSPDCNGDFIAEVADVVASTFERYRGDLEPNKKAIANVVGTKLADASYGALNLTDKLSIVRNLEKDEARALCARRLASKGRMHDLSVASL